MEELKKMLKAYRKFTKDCDEFIKKIEGEKNENICKQK